MLDMVVSSLAHTHTHSHAVLGKGEWYPSAAVVARCLVSEARDGVEREEGGGEVVPTRHTHTRTHTETLYCVWNITCIILQKLLSFIFEENLVFPPKD